MSRGRECFLRRMLKRFEGICPCDTMDHDSEFHILSILFIHVHFFQEQGPLIRPETDVDSGRSGDQAAQGSDKL